METLLEAATMAGLALVSVGLWTARVALTARGRATLAAGAAATEAVVFALVFSEVVGHLDAPARIVGYALGVGAGTLLGMRATARVADRSDAPPGRGTDDPTRAARRDHDAGGVTTVAPPAC